MMVDASKDSRTILFVKRDPLLEQNKRAFRPVQEGRKRGSPQKTGPFGLPSGRLRRARVQASQKCVKNGTIRKKLPQTEDYPEMMAKNSLIFWILC
ncbi:hypothetical protein [Brevundimonas diminuta]|uniref:hypothetical protein n=1 Tax=Brevundimonas diminuta TaxID=293 RepID=UPI003D0614C9